MPEKGDLGKDGTEGSRQAGCKEIWPRVTKGVHGETEAGGAGMAVGKFGIL